LPYPCNIIGKILFIEIAELNKFKFFWGDSNLMYKAAFWLLILITAVSLILQFSGYDILDSLIFLVVMDLTALWIYMEKRKSLSGFDDAITKRIDNIEIACLKISSGINSVSSVLNLEEKVGKQKEDINSMLEKVNEKTFNLEEKLNNFVKSLTSSVGARESSN
jgi:hypothetical protein